MTREEIKAVRQKEAADFAIEFKNTILEPYAEELYKWYQTATLPPSDEEALMKEKRSVEEMVRHCHELITILGDLRNSEIHWRNEVITDLPIPLTLEHDVQRYLISYIGESGYTVGIGLYSDPLVAEAIRVKWGDTLAWMPLTTSFEYDEDGRFTQETFDDAYDRIEKSYKASQKLFVLTNELLTREFLKFVRGLGVKLCNKTYLQVYRCLDKFGWLPKDVAHCHNTTTSRYVKENYIKSKFLHLRDDDFDWNEFITDPIDFDFLDPRK